MIAEKGEKMRRAFLENPKMVGKFLEDMTWDELEQAAKKCDGIVVVPVGSIEQHAHLPLRTDMYGAEGPARIIAEKLDNVVIAPVIPVGFSPYHRKYPGTISLKLETVMNLYRDICEALIESGFSKFLFIVGHEGDSIIVSMLGRELRERFGALTAVVAWFHLCIESGETVVSERQLKEGHSGIRESSMVYCQLPPKELKRIRAREKKYVSYGKKLSWGTENMVNPMWDEALQGVKVDLKTSTEGNTVFAMRMAGSFIDFTPYGIIGDPAKATVEYGEKIIKRTADHAIKIIEEMRKIKTPIKENKPSLI